MSALINRLDAQAPDFDARLTALLAWDDDERPDVTRAVKEILDAVRREGDAALVRYTNRFDRRAVVSPAALEVVAPAASLDAVPEAVRAALEQAAARIRNYHEKHKAVSWNYREADGTVLGQLVTPLDRVGIYVPGGKAAYPSSVLMNAIPAKVAGVGEIIMVVPAPDEHVEPVVLAAAAIAGVDRVFTIGGAQAIGALAYGTATVPAVDKIVGPGNIYVATAKSMVFGRVGIDMIAGPSEILVVCDGATDPDSSRRPSTTNRRSRSWSAPTRRFSTRSRPASCACFRRCRGPTSYVPRSRHAARSCGSPISSRRSRWPTVSRPSISNCRSPIRSVGCRTSGMPARSSSAGTRPRPSATTAPAPTTCCRPPEPRASPRPSACTISRSVPR